MTVLSKSLQGKKQEEMRDGRDGVKEDLVLNHVFPHFSLMGINLYFFSFLFINLS